MEDTAVLTQFLTFTLGAESYALDVSHVREVLEYVAITPLPRTPDYLRGVINVRGSVVPVVDLRLKLGMSRTEKSINTCIVVLDLAGTEGVLTLGVLVDAVQEVVEFDSSRIEPPPRLGTAVRSEFLTGIGKREDRFIMLLDVKNVFAEGELGELARVEASGSRE